MTVEDYPASDKDRVVAGKRDDKPDVKKPAVIKELSSPVITNGQWNPVLDNKDGWGPVSDK